MEDVYVFDMGGVIKEPFNIEKFYLEIDAKIEYNEFRKKWEENLLKAESGGIDSDEFIQRILNYAKSTKTLEEAKEIYGKYTGKIYNDTKNILEHLKKCGKKIYLLSDLKQIDFEYLKQKIDINVFENTFLSYELGCTKRETKVFNIVIDKLKLKPSNIYFFDDKKENIDLAKKVGINAYQVNGENIKKQWEELVINKKINI
ncbi:MAG: HAD-IA family hydrolase [Clostridia bacterium]|nr:HAD-IA family hydrolase [Clostridia bacterium]